MEPYLGLIMVSSRDKYLSLHGWHEGSSYRASSLIIYFVVMVSTCMCRYHGILSELHSPTSLIMLVSTPDHIRAMLSDRII